MERGPSQYLIIPDPMLTGRDNVEDVTSEAGAFPGPVSGALTNRGALAPIQTSKGDLDTDAMDIDYLLHRSGGLGSAEWVWKRFTDAADQYRGTEDPSRLWGYHSPIPVGAPGADDSTSTYSSAYKRLLVFGGIAELNRVTIGYRDVDTDRSDGWTYVVFDLERKFLANNDHALAAEELDDGTILLAVRTAASLASAVGTDVDLYKSTDGGLTWELSAMDVIEHFVSGGLTGLSGTLVDNAAMRLKRSGDFIRLCLVTDSPAIETLLATDRGQTWRRLSPKSGITASGYNDDAYPYDLQGFGDPAGTFLLAYREDTAIVRHAQASGFNDWFDISTFDIDYGGGVAVDSIGLGRTDEYIVALFFVEATAPNDNNDQWYFRRALIADNPSNPVVWETIQTSFAFVEYFPARTTIVYAGATTFVYGAVISMTTGNEHGQPFGVYMGGWSKRQFPSGRSPSLPLIGVPLVDGNWVVPFGSPIDSGDTDWTQQTNGTFSEDWTPNRFRISSTGAGSYNRFELQETVAAGGVGSWYEGLIGSVFPFWFSLDSGDSSVANEEVGYNIQAKLTNAVSPYVNFTVRIGPSDVVLYDNVAGAPLATISGLTIDNGGLGPYHEGRVWFRRTAGTTVYAQLSVREDGEEDWNATGEVILTEGSGNVDQYQRFGNLDQTQAAEMRSHWREVGVSLFSRIAGGTAQGTFVNPTELYGMQCSSSRQHVERGIQAIWSGGSGHLADEFSGVISHRHPVESIWLDSPRLDWRSSSVAAQTLIANAWGTTKNPVGYLDHDAVALFGMTDRETAIQYDSDPSFATPLPAGTLDTTRFGPFRVTGTAGGYIDYSPDPDIENPKVGEMIDLRVRVTAGGATDASWLITDHRFDGRLHCSDEATALDAQGLTVGSTFYLYADRGVLVYNRRLDKYMRFRFTDVDTHTDDHRVGHAVIGNKLPVSVQIDWPHSDNQQPNNTRFATRSGVSWAYKEGPPARTFSGRIIGDVRDRFREQMRWYMEHITDHDVIPVALVLDGDRPSETVILGRLVGGSRKDNAGWFKDVLQNWRTMGDLPFVFEEIV